MIIYWYVYIYIYMSDGQYYILNAKDISKTGSSPIGCEVLVVSKDISQCFQLPDALCKLCSTK